MQLAAESVEIKQLKHEIEAAKLNQERAIQVAESQFRRQVNLEKETEMDIQMLRMKEQADIAARKKE